MEKNYNYNYENKSQGQKLPIGYSNLGVSSCTSKVLAKSPVTNGSLWYTTDTNKFYYDWNGSRIELNLTGDSSKILAELNKIKEEIKNLNPEAVKEIVKELKGEVDSAVSTVDSLKKDVDIAVSNANDAAKVAQDAANQVDSKVDADYVKDAIAGKADVSKVDVLEVALGNKADVDIVNTLSGKVDSLETALTEKANSTDVKSAINAAVADKADASDVTTLQNTVSSLQSTKVDKSDLNGYATESWVEGKGFLTEHQDISGKANVSDLKPVATTGNYDDLENKPDLTGFATTSALDTLKSDLSTGSFPENVDDKLTQSNGYAKVQDVMNYVNALIEKKKGELAPIEPGTPYLYTNGYKIGDTPIGLTDPLNKYEIVLNENNKFEIELLHKNEEDGYYVEGDLGNSYLGVYFKVIIPSAYDIKLYMWDPNTNDYKATDTSTTDPAYALVPDVETPETTVYYYRSAVEGLFIGGHNAVEDFVNAYGHLIKAVITKK